MDSDQEHMDMKTLNGTPSTDDERRTKSNHIPAQEPMLYGIDDKPPWHVTLLFAIQLVSQTLAGVLAIPLMLFGVICKDCSPELDYVRVRLFSSTFLICGLATLLQCLVGSRLPIEQGTCVKTLIALTAYLSSRPGGIGSVAIAQNKNATAVFNNHTSVDLQREQVYNSLQEIQGCILMMGISEVLTGCTGMVGLLLKLIGPVTIAPTLLLIGLSLIPFFMDLCAVQWGISSLSAGLVILFAIFLREIYVPFPVLSCSPTASHNRRQEGTCSSGRLQCTVKRLPIFKSIPVILSISLTWLLCGIFTAADVFPDSRNSTSFRARTDARIGVLGETPWFIFSYPGQWGMPKFTIAGFLSILAAMLSSVIESVGDYYATARACQYALPPTHAINRGIAVEGLAGVLAGIFGAGINTTSLSQNIGTIGFTRVASRRVTVCLGVLLTISGFLGKFGAILTTIPDPIIGGVSVVLIGMVCSVGLASLQYANMDMARNQCIVGTSILVGLLMPTWTSQNMEHIKTGYTTADQTIISLLSNHIFVGAFIACVLDNTAPGSKWDRGVTQWLQHAAHEHINRDSMSSISKDSTENESMEGSTYDLPYITKYLDRTSWAKYVPILPQFKGFTFPSCCERNVKVDDVKL